MLERLEDELEKGATEGTSAEILLPRLVSFLGCSNEAIDKVLGSLGWQTVEVAEDGKAPARVLRMVRARTRRHKPTGREATSVEVVQSPFAGLAKLMSAR
jgi:ATP-dependent RNA helicase SUPV3L1/SUV3